MSSSPIRCDGPATLVDDGNGNAVLTVNETWRYRCDHRIVAADGDPVHNVATVSGRPRGRSVSDTDAHDVDVLHPGIEIEQIASPASGAPGSDVVYTYVVTNTGDATLFDIAVDDDGVGHVGDIGSLAPGASATRTSGSSSAPPPSRTSAPRSGSDTLGMSVSDDDATTVAVVAGATRAPTMPAGARSRASGPALVGAWVPSSGRRGCLLALTKRRSPAPELTRLSSSELSTS